MNFSGNRVYQGLAVNLSNAGDQLSKQGMRKLRVTENLVGFTPGETLNLHVRTVSTAGLSRSSSSGFVIRTSDTLPSGLTTIER